jgi:hypothetical protein
MFSLYTPLLYKDNIVGTWYQQNSVLEVLLVPMDGSLSDGLGSSGFGHEMLAERLLEHKEQIFSYKYH